VTFSRYDSHKTEVRIMLCRDASKRRHDNQLLTPPQAKLLRPYFPADGLAKPRNFD
jgi:hypothetical protein